VGVKALDIYQGSDWFTNRWVVAQAFDTLEQLQDLCLSRPWDQQVPASLDVSEILSEIADFCDDLIAELAAVEADLLPVLPSFVSQRWLSFEMNQYVTQIQKKASQSLVSDPAQLFDEIIILIARIKDALKQLDQ